MDHRTPLLVLICSLVAFALAGCASSRPVIVPQTVIVQQTVIVPQTVIMPAPTLTPAPPVVVTATRPPVTPTPTPSKAGTSRDNPVPIGQSILADDGFELTVVKVERGKPAWAKITGYNQFNATPMPGTEYVLAMLRVKFNGDSNKTQRVNSFYFRTTGDKGVIYDSPGLVITTKLASELFGGGTTEGEMAFRVGEGEGKLVLIYAGSGTTARFLSLGD